MVSDSQLVVGNGRTCQDGGQCSDRIHHLYAPTLAEKPLAPTTAIKVSAINVRVDAATKEELQADLTWMLCRRLQEQEWLQEQAAAPARVHYKHRRGPNYRPGLSLPLDWFTSGQQRHLVAHRMCNPPTVTHAQPAHHDVTCRARD